MAELSSCCSFDSRFSSWADPGSSDMGPDGWQFRASSMDSARDFTCVGRKGKRERERKEGKMKGRRVGWEGGRMGGKEGRREGGR